MNEDIIDNLNQQIACHRWNSELRLKAFEILEKKFQHTIGAIKIHKAQKDALACVTEHDLELWEVLDENA